MRYWNARAFWLSFTNYELGAIDFAFLGLKNFQKALADPVVRRSLTNTLLYVAIVLPGAVFLSLAVAIMIHRRMSIGRSNRMSRRRGHAARARLHHVRHPLRKSHRRRNRLPSRGTDG